MGCSNLADVGFKDRDDRPNPFWDQHVRKQFIKKVYFILMIQLMMFIGIVCIFVFVDKVFFWVKENWWMLFVAIGIELIVSITFCCCGHIRRTPPWNYILLALFTLATSFVLGFIAGFYAPKEVLSALGVTAAVCLTITVFAMQAKCDFTILYVGMVIVTLIFSLFSLIAYFFFYERILRIVVAAIGVTIFSLWLLIDTQMIMGGRLYQIEPDEYVLAAMCLYIDIIQIFYYILILWTDC